MTAEPMRKFFKKILNPFMLSMWRVGDGKMLNFWPKVVGRYLVICHVGRKSGRLYRTPVNYAEVDGEVYCTAGYGPRSDWFRNLMAHPETEIWLVNGHWRAKAELVEQPQLRLARLRQVLIGSGFATFAAGINPYRISDVELEKKAQDYRLVHLRRMEKL